MKQMTSKINASPFLQPGFLPKDDGFYAESLKSPLYAGSKTTLLDSLFRHFVNFSANNGLSKAALGMCLKNEKKVLPAPNCLPSYTKKHLI